MKNFKARVRYLLLGALLAPMLALGSGVIITDGGPSGEFYDPTRSGEGFFIEVADVGGVIVLVVGMFTYDLDGNLMWLTGSLVLEEGATSATLTMFIADPGTVWGPDFDPDDVVLVVWGQMTFQWPTCDTMTAAYASPVFGSGVFNHVRITQLVGVECEEKEPVSPPSGSTWTGVDVCFNVSADGSSLTTVGSLCDGGLSFTLHKEGASFGKGNVGVCIVDLDSDREIPIVNGTFAVAELDSITVASFSDSRAEGQAVETALADVCLTDWVAEPL